MKIKKLSAILLLAITLISVFSMTASALSGPYTARLYKYHNSTVWSPQVKENRTGTPMEVDVRKGSTPDAWTVGVEIVNLRARNSQLQYASDLYFTNQPILLDIAYYSNEGISGRKYALAANYDASNPYDYVDVVMYWNA